MSAISIALATLFTPMAGITAGVGFKTRYFNPDPKPIYDCYIYYGSLCRQYVHLKSCILPLTRRFFLLTIFRRCVADSRMALIRWAFPRIGLRHHHHRARVQDSVRLCLLRRTKRATWNVWSHLRRTARSFEKISSLAIFFFFLHFFLLEFGAVHVLYMHSFKFQHADIFNFSNFSYTEDSSFQYCISCQFCTWWWKP